MHYREWVTRSKIRSSSLRRMLARRTNASECSSSQWQTPNCLHGGGANRGGDRQTELLLPGQAKNWPTATTPDRGPESKESRGAGGIDLQTVAANWPSARAEDAESAGNHPGATDSLRGAIKNWATASAADSKRTLTSESHPSLPMQAANWTTPQAHDVTARGVNQTPSSAAGNACLHRDALNWASPVAADDGHKVTPASKQSGLIGQSATFPCSHPAETTTDAGLSSLLAVWTPPSRRALSADFQHWLMGWPSPIRTCFDSAATELWRSRLAWHLSRLCGDCETNEAMAKLAR